MPIGPRLIANPGARGGGGKTKGGPRPPLKIESRVGVRAPPEAVWDVIKDLSAWGEWSGMYARASGELRIGAPLSLTLTLPGEEPREITPRMVDWMPYEQILWTDTHMRGWAKSLRYFEIDQLDTAASAFSNGEAFQGRISEWYGRKHRKVLRKAFEDFSMTVKARAEALWNARQSGTI